VILITASAILLLDWASLPIVMDNACVLDRGEWPCPFSLWLWVGARDLVLDLFRNDRSVGLDGGGDNDGGNISLLCIDRVLTRDRVVFRVLFSLGLPRALDLGWCDSDIQSNVSRIGLLYGCGYFGYFP
jgi:hypothetical protein